MAKTRILIIEDNRVLLDGLRRALNRQADMRVVATMASGDSVLLKARQTKPHVILFDVGLNHFDELALVESVRKNLPEAKVIGMGIVPSQSDVVLFMAAGASGFILKDTTVKDAVTTIRSIAQGEKILPPSLADSLFSHVVERSILRRNGTITNAVRMTKRELEIIVLIADGLSNKEIAQRLKITTHTVKSHVHNIMGKLSLHTRRQLAKYTRNE
jgi:NarL family two-component system response regulator LiaR